MFSIANVINFMIGPQFIFIDLLLALKELSINYQLHCVIFQSISISIANFNFLLEVFELFIFIYLCHYSFINNHNYLFCFLFYFFLMKFIILDAQSLFKMINYPFLTLQSFIMLYTLIILFFNEVFSSTLILIFIFIHYFILFQCFFSIFLLFSLNFIYISINFLIIYYSFIIYS